MQAIAEHLRMHALVRALRRGLVSGDSDPETMRDLARLLTTHVRAEEHDLLPLVERLIPEEELVDLATAGRRDV